MSGKPSLKNELIEEVMEAFAMQTAFATDLEQVLKLLGENETIDHQNDKVRNESMSFLLGSLEAYNAKDYEGMQKFTHAGVQKLHEQAKLDFKDDKPRTDVKIKLVEVSCKAVHNARRIRALLEKLKSSKGNL